MSLHYFKICATIVILSVRLLSGFVIKSVKQKVDCDSYIKSLLKSYVFHLNLDLAIYGIRKYHNKIAILKLWLIKLALSKCQCKTVLCCLTGYDSFHRSHQLHVTLKFWNCITDFKFIKWKKKHSMCIYHFKLIFITSNYRQIWHPYYRMNFDVSSIVMEEKCSLLCYFKAIKQHNKNAF